MNKIIDDFLNSSEWKKFKDYYEGNSFIEQLGMFRFEDANSNFLASILKENNIYKLGLEPMKHFLKLIKEKNNNKAKEEYLKDIDLDKKYEIKYLNIKTRRKLKYKNKENVTPDMYITFTLKQNNVLKKYLIILEAKLKSVENELQTFKYYESVKDYDVEKIFVYLTLNGGECKSEYYNLISYQDLIDKIYDNFNSNKIISEYLKIFNSLYDIYDTHSYLKYITISTDGKELTKRLLKKSLTIDNFWNGENLWKDVYLKQSHIFKIFIINILRCNELGIIDYIPTKSTKDLESIIKRMSKIIVVNNEKIKYDNNTIYNLLKALIKINHIDKMSQFDYRILNTTGNWKNIISIDEYNQLPKESKKNREPHQKWYNTENIIEIAKQKYYVMTSSDSDIENFLIALEECYPEYYEENISIEPYIKK